MAECIVNIQNIDKKDEGIWRLTYFYVLGKGKDNTYNFTVNAADGVNDVRQVVVDEGSSHTLSVTTAFHLVENCHLTTPHDKKITFKPGDESQSTDKYRIDRGQDIIAECMVTIQNIDKNDEGIWVMSYDTDTFESRIQSYNFTVNGEEIPEPNEEELEEENLILLSEINHLTRQEMLIDISLNKESFNEECYVRPPGGELIKTDLLEMENVKVQDSSNYVSCRITIGPMVEDLLGEWRLCGKSVKTKKMRCQPANIAWNNNNAIAAWDSVLQTRFSHPVHYGGSVNSGVAGRGDVINCHVVTPNGEDLVMKTDVKYPHVERIAIERPSLCSIKFTDIDSSSIGDWSIYGKFRATSGLNEAHLPLNFFLYNENDPYEQAYNVTVLPMDRHLVILGTTVDVEVSSNGGKVDDCRLRMPSGEIYDLRNTTTVNGLVFKSLDTATNCRLSINPVTKEMLGEWQLIGKFSNGNQFSERRQSFHIIQEDPANPIIDDYRVVENLSERILDTQMGVSHRVTINTAGFVENESCHILTPQGLQYAFIDGFNVPYVEIIEEIGVECGVVVDVQNTDMLGEWTLIARATRFSEHIERRLDFTIRVEETFSLGSAINITEGSDLYVRLPHEISRIDTCKLYGPDGGEVTHYEVDELTFYACGYIIRDVNPNHHGTWAIVYGEQITYRGTVQVNILGSSAGSEEITDENVVWTVGTSVDVTGGPEDAVYCRVENNYGYTVYDRFGRCKIKVDRVTIGHRGTYKMFVGVPGRILLQEHRFHVDVREADLSPVVTTSVIRNEPSVYLTCSVPAQYEVQACKFRNPRGRILLANHGVGEDGYTFLESFAGYENGTQIHGCILRVTNPSVQDLGLWNCAVDTDQDTYYSFMTVVCPWLTQDEDVAASIVTEPVLQARRSFLNKLEDEPVEMSCSIDSAILYCYFRDSNGTIFNVEPAVSSSQYEYVGRGLDAGDCGIRFSSLMATDSGTWSCHVGLVDTKAAEQRDTITVQIREKISVFHYWEDRMVVVRGEVADSPLDYCRFVRIDGQGFTADNSPPGYEVRPNLGDGLCVLHILSPNILDVHPWTVAAKITGVNGEVSKSTIETLLISPPGNNRMSCFAILLWVFVIVLGFILIGAAVAFVPKKNREWTYNRASQFRNSFRKQPLPNDILTDLPRKV